MTTQELAVFACRTSRQPPGEAVEIVAGLPRYAARKFFHNRRSALDCVVVGPGAETEWNYFDRHTAREGATREEKAAFLAARSQGCAKYEMETTI